ncbi:MAG: ribosome silencing factor [Acidobacteria bacterium]|nr:MAG: ribosome silencing factor [Acidobacteriota bacterium]
MNYERGMKMIRDIILKKAMEFDAEAVKEYNVEGKCGYADLFVIMTCNSPTKIKALTEKIIFECKHSGNPVLGVEGVEEGEWCLLDFGDIIVNIMTEEKRALYKLEDIWENM